MAALFAIPAGRLAARTARGCRRSRAGSSSRPASCWPLSFVGLEPALRGAWLPGFLLGGIGVGLVLPSLPTAATAPLPPDRFATGTAVFAMSRQIGSAIGVAIFVAIVGNASGPALLDALRDAWWFILGTGLAAAALAAALPASSADLTAAKPGRTPDPAPSVI